MKVKYFSFIGLVLSFVALFAAFPFASYNQLLSLIILICFTAIAFFSVYAVAEHKVYFVISIILAAPGLLIDWITPLDASLTAQIIDIISSIMFYCYVCYVSLLYIFHRSVVNVNVIYGAIVVYLMFGLIWACCYTLLELTSPGSFQGLIVQGSNLSPAESITEYMQSLFYFSYITLTTLGYGNIAPQSVTANALCAAEVVIGQLYLTILIARFVGLHVSQSRAN